MAEAPREDGIKFVGKPPPQFYEALKNVKTNKEDQKFASQKDPFADVLGECEPNEVPKPQPKQPQQVKPQQGKVRTVGSAQLEDLLSQLREQSYVYDEKKLPSLGVFYDGSDGPTDGVLHIRPMTGEEEQILATPRFVRKGLAINMIFQRCIKENIKPDNLLSVDRTYLLIWLRGISYGHAYEVEIRCPECDKKFPHTINLDQLMVNYCPTEFRSPLSDVLPKSGLKFNWRLPRGKDENQVTDYRERRTKEFGESAVDDSLLYRMALMLDDIEGLSNKTEILVLLKKLHIQDIAYLRNLSSEPPFGVDTKCGASCGYCFHDFEVELPLEAGFFFPRHKHKKVDESLSSGDT